MQRFAGFMVDVSDVYTFDDLRLSTSGAVIDVLKSLSNLDLDTDRIFIFASIILRGPFEYNPNISFPVMDPW